MDYRFRARKVGGNWYLDIEHRYYMDVQLCEKASKYLSLFGYDDLYIELTAVYTFVDSSTIFFEEEDVRRYLMTDDDFDIRFWIGNHLFTISSDLYYLLENLYNVNFHKTLYEIRICTI